MVSPVVTVSQGRLTGRVQSDIDGGHFFAFLGIPYAKPPLGELRFKAPVPAEPWRGIRDATVEGSPCYAKDDITRKIGGSEDCLFLNVFTKKLPETNKSLRPVMVFIHGGGFVYGSSKQAIYGPDLLMTEDIVLVTLNYRLGVLGFLSLKDTSLEVPGNAGLKDQSLALKWVQQNITHFNGDPNNVTIFGESAGSASVHYHILSKPSRGLFHKAILQSGSALNPWATGFNVAEEFANYLSGGHNAKNEKEALEVLKNTPVEVLYEYQEKFMAETKARPFTPVVEQPNDTAFITKAPIDIIISGEYNKMPIIIGYTTREGMLMDALRIIEEQLEGKSVETHAPDLEETIEMYLRVKKGSEVASKLYPMIKEVYTKSSDEADNERLFVSDAIFVAAIMASLKNHLATTSHPVYVYRMSVDTGLNFLKNVAHLNHLPGVSHADDLGYLFKNILTPEIKPGSLEDVSFRRFVKLWTNFARYGNPTHDKHGVGVIWPPAKEGQINYLDIGSELTLGTNPESERMALWSKLYQLNPGTANFL